VMEDEIFFRSNTRIFQFKDSTIRVDKAPTQWQFLGKVAGSVCPVWGPFAALIRAIPAPGEGTVAGDTVSWGPA